MKSRLLFAMLLLPLMLRAQHSVPDSCSSSIAWPQIVVPTVLFSSGSAISFSTLHDSFDLPVRDYVQRDGHSRFEIENYLQYSTCAAPLVLNACGVKGKSDFRDLVAIELWSSVWAAALNTGLKYSLCVERPYGGVYNSFPSGHTVTAFMGAEILRREYGEDYPAIAIAGYVVAASVGLLRIYNNRHWASDVLAGAGIGILSASIGYWLTF